MKHISNIILLPPRPTTISLILALTAFILSSISLPFCNYATLSTIITVYNGNEWLILLQTELGVGMYRHQTLNLNDGLLVVTNTCVEYDTNKDDEEGERGGGVEIDAMWSVARMFGIIALIIGGLNLLWGCCWYVFGRMRLSSSDDDNTVEDSSSVINNANENVVDTTDDDAGGEEDDIANNNSTTGEDSATRTSSAPCNHTQRQSRITSTIIYIITAICQGLSLLFLHSSICTGESNLGLDAGAAEVIHGRECSLSVGAKMGVASALLWFMAGVFLCLPEPRCRRNELTVVETNKEHPVGAPSNEEAAVETGDVETPTKAVDTSAETEELDCEHDVVGELDTAINITASGGDDGDDHEEEESTAYVGTVAAESTTEYVGTVAAESTTEYVGTVRDDDVEGSSNMQRQSKGVASSPKRMVKRAPQTRRRRYRS